MDSETNIDNNSEINNNSETETKQSNKTSSEYDKYLNVFFNSLKEQKCDECTGVTYYKKNSISEYDFVIECKSQKCLWGKKVSVNKYLNIDEKLAELKRHKTGILFSINNSIRMDDEDTFNKLKKDYDNINQQINDLEKQYIDNKKKLMEYNDKIYNFSRELYKLFFNRKKVYESINYEKFNSGIKDDLLKIYKNEIYNNGKSKGDSKELDVKRLNQISSQLKIDVNDIKKIFEWFGLSTKYIIENNKRKELERDLEDIRREFQYNVENYLEAKYSIETLKKSVVDKVDKTDNVDKSSKVDDVDKVDKKRKRVRIKIKTSGKKL